MTGVPGGKYVVCVFVVLVIGAFIFFGVFVLVDVFVLDDVFVLVGVFVCCMLYVGVIGLVVEEEQMRRGLMLLKERDM